jgi:hypothetical protein
MTAALPSGPFLPPQFDFGVLAACALLAQGRTYKQVRAAGHWVNSYFERNRVKCDEQSDI